ncbi:MAG TPA: hypothetical protein VLT82_15645 [Myxococcaceae bacterium]|nr:hypothetical protein [Myxococcaceae bacterium]
MTTSRSDGPARRSAIIVDEDRGTREMLPMARALEDHDVTLASGADDFDALLGRRREPAEWRSGGTQR